MKKLLVLLGAVSVAGVHSCSQETVVPSGTPVCIMETVTEASYDDKSGIYKAILNNGGTSVTVCLGIQPGGVSMERPEPATGNYTVTSTVNSNIICDGSSWTDENGTFVIGSGTISVIAGNDGTAINGSVSDGRGRSFRFEAENVNFTHSVEPSVLFDNCSISFSDETFVVDMRAEGVVCEFCIPAGPDIAELPAGSYSLSEGTLTNAMWNGTAVSDMTLCVLKKADLYTVSGTVSGNGIPESRIVFDGGISSGQNNNISDLISGSWVMNADSWYVYNESDAKWEISDSYDGQYAMDIIGMHNKSYMMLCGLFRNDFNVLGRVNETSIVVDANPRTNPVAHINTTEGGFWLFLTLFDPDIEYLMIWDDVEFKVSDDFGTISTVEEIKEFTNSQTGQKNKAHYRYLGLIGLNDAGEKVVMFEEWPFVELPTFTRPGVTPSSDGREVRISDAEPLKSSGTITSDKIISVTPLYY